MLQMEVFGYHKNKMVRIMNKSIVILPHFDDEIFQIGAFLLKYKEEIELFITHPNDTISNSLYNLQKKLFNLNTKIHVKVINYDNFKDKDKMLSFFSTSDQLSNDYTNRLLNAKYIDINGNELIPEWRK